MYALASIGHRLPFMKFLRDIDLSDRDNYERPKILILGGSYFSPFVDQSSPN